MAPTRYSVGLEEGPDAATRVHSLELLGCTAEGTTREEALAAFPAALSQWLRFFAASGEALPPAGAQLEVSVDEWVRTDVAVGEGGSDVCFEADLRVLSEREIAEALRRLGDLRGALLRGVRRLPDAELDARGSQGWSLRQILDELARAQWWTLSRLGASPLAEVPPRTLARLDTAMALVVDRFTSLPPDRRAAVLELEGETWTPRKVLRRLLSLEWSLGRAALRAVAADAPRSEPAP